MKGKVRPDKIPAKAEPVGLLFKDEDEKMAVLMDMFQLLLKRRSAYEGMSKKTLDGMNIQMAEILMHMAGNLVHEVDENIASLDAGIALCLSLTDLIEHGADAC